MGKYSASFKQVFQKPRPWEIHPVWRGIGCLLIILLPILSLAASRLLIQENSRQQWVSVPRFLWFGFTMPAIGRIYLVDLAVSILLLAVIFGILTVIYSLIFRIFAPRGWSNLFSRRKV